MRNIITIITLIFIFSSAIIGKTDIDRIDTTEEQLIYPGKILEGPGKNIYIYDSQDAFIKVFSPEGKLIRKIGGKGEGPGQLKRAEGADFGFTPDGRSIWFTEYFMGHRWMSFLDLNGKVKRTIQYKFEGFFGIPRAEICRDGTILIQKQVPSKTVKKRDVYYAGYRDEIHILHSDGRSTPVNPVRESIATISFIQSGGDIGIPFTPRFMWALTGKGNILFTEGITKFLTLFSGRGKEIRKIYVPIPELHPVTKEDLENWKNRIRDRYRNRDKSWYKRFGSVIEKYTKSIFKFKPVILGMSLTPAGNIFLKCRTGEKTQFKYILTKINGELITESVSEFPRIQISKNYIFFMKISEDEEEEISFLKRSGEEKEDLTKLFLSEN